MSLSLILAQLIRVLFRGNPRSSRPGRSFIGILFSTPGVCPQSSRVFSPQARNSSLRSWRPYLLDSKLAEPWLLARNTSSPKYNQGLPQTFQVEACHQRLNQRLKEGQSRAIPKRSAEDPASASHVKIRPKEPSRAEETNQAPGECKKHERVLRSEWGAQDHCCCANLPWPRCESCYPQA